MRSEEVYAKSLELHRAKKGKVAIESKMAVNSMADLALAYTPGVAEPCREIGRKKDAIYEVTSKANMVAVITDGTAVLGLGDIGPDAALPVMEGKSILFKRFADIDAFPICINSKDSDEIVRTASLILSSFGGVNLEDIAAPRCFEIEKKLQEVSDIPIFHDDQHGTAVIVLSGIINALKVVGKKIADVKIVMSGAGAAGTAICKFLMSAGAKNVIMCDRSGAIYKGRPEHMNWAKEELADLTNPNGEKGSIGDVMKGADVFLGLSGPGIIDQEMVKGMAPKAIIFAMANPTPEIYPDEAIAAGAAVVATGRSDYPNQINNCLGFPGIFRGALDVRASVINEEMKLAAAYALAGLIPDEELRDDRIITEVMDDRVVPAIASAVAEAARKTGVARI
ncbi:MAG: NAD-dependent malic enzyme [Synergistaceae bacterium]|jgi:malate dehydrogenase (oxaloacetate-decarboxylating)|uniref:NAD(P)-dependent malic enzyme n=1 Tax=Aminivibrio sp. TaxID=1872489 RepID=UPI0016B89382|nr:NAD-dependent malic enzyme [Synergistaceae bacterium]MDD3391686.1 NAD-dependent malic enzyme [Synergistaceae bacterium]MDD3690362.1 NAD-dependent malic enzyme [Synergistaceae bacterium]MDD4021413.1 NAD-dependent malic enzyme [Synergistaceae bacterium]MDD4612024.1 NAD-dependent malic enzyme [Synergistaceae bacterium]